MRIQIEPHTLARAKERGATLQEIEETILNGTSFAGKKGRLARSKVFDFRSERNGSFYQEKKVEVFYLIENETIITITVYVFYGKF